METPNCPMCQSCGMPMCKDEDKGTNADGNKNEEFCTYCYQNGQYTNPNISMEEMKKLCVEGMSKMSNIPSDQAQKMVEEFLPKLKRWQP